ncbi:hypothetical protein COL05_07375 [Bacillus sp. AFS059628]|nr:hypothetical protein COL05_07375 [Bacillus sp. AFS059628]
MSISTERRKNPQLIKDGVGPIFYLFLLKTFQIVHIDIGLTRDLTLYVIQRKAREMLWEVYDYI